MICKLFIMFGMLMFLGSAAKAVSCSKNSDCFLALSCRGCGGCYHRDNSPTKDGVDCKAMCLPKVKQAVLVEEKKLKKDTFWGSIGTPDVIHQRMAGDAIAYKVSTFSGRFYRVDGRLYRDSCKIKSVKKMGN